jgi:pimeloyl-ACP methyl ester carboxylesterase
VHFRAFPTNWIVQDRFESWRVAPDIRVPTTVIVAEHDVVIPMAHTQRLLTHFRPGVVRLVLLSGEDHSSFLDKPAYYAALGASPRAAAAVHATTEHAPTLPLAEVAAAEDEAAAAAPGDAADHAA